MYKKSLKAILLILLAISGVALIAVSISAQSGIISESNSYSIGLFETIKYNLISRNWWYIVGIPFLMGIVVLTILMKINKNGMNSSRTKKYLLFMFIFSIISTQFTMIEGYIVTFVSIICLIILVMYKKHNNIFQPTQKQRD